MLKYLTHKLRTQSINEDYNVQDEKVDGHDSGTESDGDLDHEHDFQPEPDIELSMSSRHDTTSPTDTACSSESPAMLGQAHLYDQHSSEEELEVINGPSSVAAAAVAASASISSILPTLSSAASESSSIEPEEIFDESPRRASSTILETRKRSLAHSSDDEVRSLLEPVPAPVNFRTSPPLEALKPNRSHMFRATTPLILTETGRGIESIRISCDSSYSSKSNNFSPLNASSRTSDVLQQYSQTLPHTTISHFNCRNGNSPASSSQASSALAMDVRSVSPPAKLFHCAISPRRRPPRPHHHHHHAPQRLQRPHRPCLDFDKMQQLKARSVTSWRHNNEHTGELSVFCW